MQGWLWDGTTRVEKMMNCSPISRSATKVFVPEMPIGSFAASGSRSDLAMIGSSFKRQATTTRVSSPDYRSQFSGNVATANSQVMPLKRGTNFMTCTKAETARGESVG